MALLTRSSSYPSHARYVLEMLRLNTTSNKITLSFQSHFPIMC